MDNGSFRNPSDGLTYVWIPPNPNGKVGGFWISTTPVTQVAYRRITGGNPSYYKDDQLPVESVTWHEADAYCRAIGGRLPNEKEWEYAARAGTTGDLYGDLDKIAWYNANSGNETHPVAQKQPNGYGLYDMLGNVWEWMDNWFDIDKRYKSLRGGSWNDFPEYVRVSLRDRYEPEVRDSYIGFRCVFSDKEPEAEVKAVAEKCAVTLTATISVAKDKRSTNKVYTIAQIVKDVFGDDAIVEVKGMGR